MPGNGYREKKKKEFVKPWRKEKPQVAPVIDEHPRQCGLPVSHSKPNCHSRFSCVFANSVWFLPGCHFWEQTKTRQYKAACQTFPRRDRGAVSNEDEGEERDCKDFWKHPFHLTHIPEKSWARQWVKLLITAEAAALLPTNSYPCSAIENPIKWLREALMGGSRAQRGTKGPGRELGAAGNWRKDQLRTEVLLFMHH